MIFKLVPMVACGAIGYSNLSTRKKTIKVKGANFGCGVTLEMATCNESSSTIPIRRKFFNLQSPLCRQLLGARFKCICYCDCYI